MCVCVQALFDRKRFVCELMCFTRTCDFYMEMHHMYYECVLYVYIIIIWTECDWYAHNPVYICVICAQLILMWLKVYFGPARIKLYTSVEAAASERHIENAVIKYILCDFYLLAAWCRNVRMKKLKCTRRSNAQHIVFIILFLFL